MKKLELSLAVGIYDRTFPIFDGQVEIEGCEVNAVPLLPEECFHRAFKFMHLIGIRRTLVERHRGCR